MRKYTKWVMYSFFALILTITIANVKLAKAEDSTELTYINGLINSGKYPEEIWRIIYNKFPNFNIPASEFYSRVNGKNSYKILEITPESYSVSSSEVSDLKTNLDKLKTIYRSIANGVYFVDNMQYFEIETVTIKEFVSSRETIEGKYDAIVFDNGDYTNEQVMSCYFDYDLSKLQYKELYKNGGSGKIIYTGYVNSLGNYHGYGEKYQERAKDPIFDDDEYNDSYSKDLEYQGEFNNGAYHGYGKLYHSSGRLIYDGGFINNQRSCFGITYYNNNKGNGPKIEYRGQWKNDLKHGYGTEYNEDGTVKRTGYYENGIWMSSTYKPSTVLNGLTELKFQEIIDYYVEKNLPVFINNNVNLFNGISTNYENVFNLVYPEGNIDFTTTLTIMKITELYSQKPYVTVKKPAEINVNTNKPYVLNDTVDFEVTLENMDNASLSLYFDVNQNDKFESNEAAVKLILERGKNTFSYPLSQLNNGKELYSGLYNYKLEIMNADLSTVHEGNIKYKGEQPTIKVLNVVSEQVSVANGLLNPQFVKSYFENPTKYNYFIDVDFCSVQDFSKNGNYGCSHLTVMNQYDVILLGQDIFNKPMNNNVYNSIQAQIDNGKPVIFTSSVTKGNNKWVSYYQDDIGLDHFRTDLYKLELNTNRLHIVNHNKYTQYPFDMYETELYVPEHLNYAINEKHQADLNDPDLIPLMNMYHLDSDYNRFDSYNNFYYMKNNNVIYLNIGNNSFKVYKDIEHKLLANAIINSYIQFKSKDNNVEKFFNLEVNNTFENSLIDIKESVKFSFNISSNIEDEYTYELSIEGKPEYSGNIVDSGLVEFDIKMEDLISINPGSAKQVRFSLKVSSKNNSSNSNNYNFNVFVANLDNYGIFLNETKLNSSKDIVNYNNQTYLKICPTCVYSNTYEVVLGSFTLDNIADKDALPKTLTISNLTLTQAIPNNIRINYDDDDDDNSVLTKILGNYTYELNGTTYAPKPYNPISVTVPFTVNEPDNYSFPAAIVSFKGIGDDPGSVKNGSKAFVAKKPITRESIMLGFEEYLFIEYGSSISALEKEFYFDSEIIDYNKTKFITSGSIFNLINNNGSIEVIPNTIGEQSFTYEIFDIFGERVPIIFDIKSYVPIESLEIDDISLYINEKIELEFPVDAGNILFKKLDTASQVASITRNGNKIIIEGLKKGYNTFEFFGYDSDGYKLSTTVTIVVNERLDITFKNFFLGLFIGDTFYRQEMEALVELDGYEYDQIEWISHNEAVASVDVDGTITANGVGVTIIEAKLPNGKSSQLIVKVYEVMSQDSGFDQDLLDTIKAYQGYKHFLKDYIKLIPGTLSVDDELIKMIFTIEAPDGVVVEFDEINNTIKTDLDEDVVIYLHVTIIQYDRNGEVKTSTTSECEFTIHKIVDPRIDKGHNAS